MFDKATGFVKDLFTGGADGTFKGGAVKFYEDHKMMIGLITTAIAAMGFFQVGPFQNLSPAFGALAGGAAGMLLPMAVAGLASVVSGGMGGGSNTHASAVGSPTVLKGYELKRTHERDVRMAQGPAVEAPVFPHKPRDKSHSAPGHGAA